jgi:hypothetical protein
MPATETKTLVIGVDGYDYMIGQDVATARSIWEWGEHFEIQRPSDYPSDTEYTAYEIAVVRALFESSGYSHVQDQTTFRSNVPQPFRIWLRTFRKRWHERNFMKEQWQLSAAEPASNVCTPFWQKDWGTCK